MKWLLVFFMCLMTDVTLADEVRVELNPAKPVAGEVFQAYFRIFTDSDQEPDINFTPGGMEVVGKANQGISTRTVYANGRLTVSREITVVYDLTAPRTGTSYLRDIRVDVGGKTIRHPTIAVSVLKEPEVAADLFIMADVPKKNLYVGEGVIVRYFLYSKFPLNNVDIKRYPKLNGFLKRFLQEADRAERVSVDNQLYLRNQIYAAKLFPEKPGELKIDSLELSATFPNVRSNDPFGAFGMNRNFRTKTLSSDTVKIQVLPLPAPVPPHFTGLVGRHDFQVQFGQSKLIVNEPLEVKLTVSGGGALENLEAPAIIKHPGLEEFESNGDLKIANADEATKTFDYTFLAKENFKLPASTMALSYFDADSQKYVSVSLPIPEIEVAGGGVKSPQGTREKKGPEKIEEKNAAPVMTAPKVPELAAPILAAGRDYRVWLPYLNASLAVLSILLALSFVIKRDGFGHLRPKTEVPSYFRKGQFSLGEFTKWLSPIIQKTGKSPSVIIRESALEDETKTYFIDLLNANDYKDYSAKKAQLQFSYHPGHFKRLGRYIESVKDENPSQPA